MATVIRCRACAHQFKRSAERSHRPIVCPQCDFQPDQFAHEILSALDAEIKLPKTSPLYSVGIFLVAFVMLLLPMIYVGLIAVVAYLAYLHVIHVIPYLLTDSNQSGRQRGAAIILGAFGPLFAAVVLLIFMLKPLLAPRPQSSPVRVLDPGDAPLLFEFVTRLCNLLGAPPPREIRVDCQVNASASFRQGWLGFPGRDLVLTIGLPLATGLTLRQFTGVLAHEFGHFTQGAGMRMQFFIRSINAWFARVVYARDAWDERLVKLGNWMPGQLHIVYWLVLLLVWLTRRILWGLMVMGHAISCFMSREMEYNADLFETRVAGSDTFVSTVERIQFLMIGWQGAIADLNHLMADGQLADNICALVQTHVHKLPTDLRRTVIEEAAKRRTGWFDTHPSDGDRVRHARKDNAPGIFQIEGRTEPLFNNYPKLATAVSEEFYRQALGERYNPSGLVTVEKALARREAIDKESEELTQYLGGAFTPLRPINLSGKVSKLPRDLRSARRALGNLRQTIEAQSSSYKRTLEKYDNNNTRWMEAEIAAILLRNDVSVSEEAFHLTGSDLKSAIAACKQTVSRRQKLAEQLEPMENMGMRRLALALSLLDVPELAYLFPEGESWRREVSQLRVISRRLTRYWPALLELRNYHTALELALQNLKDRNTQTDLVNAIHSIMGMVAEKISTLHKELCQTPYPFEHATKDISVGQYVLEKLPTNDDLGGIYEAGKAMQGQLVLLAMRTAGRLAYIASAVEKGIEPIATTPENSIVTTTPESIEETDAESVVETAVKPIPKTPTENATESREKKPNPFLGYPDTDLSTHE